MLGDIPAEELSSCLDGAVAHLLAEAGIQGPPVDTLRIAKTLGIVTAVDAEQDARARYVELRAARGGPPRAAIFLRPEPRAERRQWAVAHELGERLAPTIFDLLAIDARCVPPGTREWVANQVANRLLLPTPWFALAGTACDWDLPALKARFPTASHELIARRWLDLELPVVVTIFDHGKLEFRRANTVSRFPLTVRERNLWRRAHESGDSQRHDEAYCTVRAWPIHEPEWKRELLRLDLHYDASEETWAEDLADVQFGGTT